MKRRGVDSVESWVVAIALSLSYMLYPLLLRLGGQLFVSILDSYQISRYAASFPFSVAFLVRSLAGPFAGYFGNKFGLQETIMIGSIFCVIGVGGCYFAEDIITINIFLGFLHGLGVGITTSLSPEVINQHFKKHRAKSMGVVFGGSSLGVFIFSPLLENILYNYGLSGTFLIMSAILLNIVPATMLLTKPKSEEKVVEKIPIAFESRDCTDLRSSMEKTDCTIQCESGCNVKELSLVKKEIKLHEDMCVILKENISNDHTQNYQSEYLEEVDQHIIPCQTISNQHLSTKKFVNHSHQYQTQIGSKSTNQFFKLPNQQRLENDGHFNDHVKKIICINKPKSQACITQSQNISHEISTPGVFPERRPSYQRHQILLGKLHSSLGQTENLEKFDMDSKQSNIASAKYFSSCSSVGVLWSPLFLIVTYIQSSHFYLTYILWTIIVDVVRDKEVDEHLAVYFVMALSISDMVGRFALGCITDNGYMTRSNFSAVCFTVMGLSSLVMIFVSGFTATMIAICVLNVACGVNTTALPGIVTQFFHGDKRTVAMASRTLLYVPMSFTMSPLIGYFRGNLGSYDGLFYCLAAMCMITTALLVLLPKMICLRNK